MRVRFFHGSGFLILLAACGGGTKSPVSPSPSVSAGKASAPAPSALPSSALAFPGPKAAASVAPAPVATSAVANAQTDRQWATCHQSHKSRPAEVAKAVAAIAKACEAVTHMQPSGKPLTGSQADANDPESFPLDGKAGHCYRVYGQASDGIQDLDVVIKDSSGIIVAQDSTEDPSPVVSRDGAVCFHQNDKASIVVSVGMGKGTYAIEVDEGLETSSPDGRAP